MTSLTELRCLGKRDDHSNTCGMIVQTDWSVGFLGVLSTSEKCTKNAEVKVYHFMLLAMHFLVLAR
jgi:hypothetical protein